MAGGSSIGSSERSSSQVVSQRSGVDLTTGSGVGSLGSVDLSSVDWDHGSVSVTDQRPVGLEASVVEGWEARSVCLGGPLHNSGLGSVVSLEEGGLGLNNGGSILDWLSDMDGSHSEVGGTDGKVVRGDTEAEVVSNIVDGVDSSLVSVAVGPGNSSVSVASLLLGTVDVLVTVGNVTQLVLSLVLRAVSCGDGGSRGNDWSSLGNNWSSHSRDSSHGRDSSTVRGHHRGGSGGGHDRGGGSIEGGDRGSVGKVGWS